MQREAWSLIRRGIACAAVTLCLWSDLSAQDLAESPVPDAALPRATRDWSATLAASFRLLMLEHSVRVAAESKTRRELGGPFWRDYANSVRWPRQWSDGDGWQVNYVGHPVHGAAAGWLWLEHAPSRPADRREYLRSRVQAAAFAGLYSLQFEIGPLSEASIGNVGLRPETTGWTDHVMTPVGAFGIMLLEDAVDRHVLSRLEARISNRLVRNIVRMTLNPGRGLANLSQGRAPWNVDVR